MTALRRALVTGGSSPIGSAICRRLAADGREVLVHAHAVMLKAYGPDVSDTRDAVKALDKLRIAMKKPAASR